MGKKIGIIGYGSMGKMIFSKIIETMHESDIFLSDIYYEQVKNLQGIYPELNTFRKNSDVAKNVDILFICVKPLDIKTVLSEIFEEMSSNCHIVALNDGILISQMEQKCPGKKITKIIPSITGEVNRSVTLMCHNNHVKAEDTGELKTLLEQFGTVVEIPESEIGMGSELTACMPGFIGAIFKVITDEAKRHTTMTPESIIKMIAQTIYGTGKLFLEKEMTFDQIVTRVATKGGITEEGTKVIETKMPEIINELFEKTLDKRKIITEKAQKEFDAAY